jgi:hypothetical protein
MRANPLRTLMRKRRAAPSFLIPLGGRTTYVVGLGALWKSGGAAVNGWLAIFQFVTVSSDARLMAAGAQHVRAAMRAGQKPAAASGSY